MSANSRYIIFLDIDGVLHSFDYENYLIEHNKEQFDYDGAIFAPDCIKALDKLIRTTKAKIVISSSWKDSRICPNALSVMKGIWEHRNLPGEIIDVTPTLTPDEIQSIYGIRTTMQWKGYEIDMWLQHNPQYQSYLIIDDEDVALDYQKLCFIKTDGNKGLQNRDVKRAIKIFRLMCNRAAHQQIKPRQEHFPTWLFRLFSSMRTENHRKAP